MEEKIEKKRFVFECALNLELFRKNDDPHSCFLSEITHSGKRG